jgi:para-aminobenzoate synthetase component I
MIVREVPDCSAAEAAMRLSPRTGLAWLDGDCAGGREARYSVVASDPVEVLRIPAAHPKPLSVLDALTRDAGDPHAAPDHPLLPRSAVPRFIGYLAYDAVARRQQRHTVNPDEALACFHRYDACLVVDHEAARTFVAGDDAAACDRLQARLQAPPHVPACTAGPVIAADPTAHAEAIERALEHIRRGDIYQVNLARAFTAQLTGDALKLALAMREASQVPLGFYFDDGQRSVIARTMERFLRFDASDRSLTTRPIKGTLARDGDDLAEARTLVADPKERAEHAMIIDLMRNDLGRVAEVGSVRVPEVMVVEHYAKLSHLVSTVRCTVRAGLGLRAIVEATFPPGSVTGTPKLRAMDIIDALEPTARGVYTGAVGFVDRAGGLSLAVAIRTASVRDGQARYFAGGGIVEASDVAREVAETELKARVFRDALASLSGLSEAPVLR